MLFYLDMIFTNERKAKGNIPWQRMKILLTFITHIFFLYVIIMVRKKYSIFILSMIILLSNDLNMTKMYILLLHYMLDR
jgi:hypothetical protein